MYSVLILLKVLLAKTTTRTRHHPGLYCLSQFIIRNEIYLHDITT